MGQNTILGTWNTNNETLRDLFAKRRINPKMGFWRAKQGLSNTWDLKTKLVSKENKKREEREKREEEKRKRKKKRGRRRNQAKVWN